VKPGTVAPARPACAPLPLRIGIVVLVLTVSAVFLFARLGHYSLWDDEALTALPALNVWRTGDTSLRHGKNIMAERDGTSMTGLYHRVTQPLMFYLAAPSIGLLGRNSWAARLPCAICGFGCVALMLRWMWREKAGALTWVLLALSLLGNVSFFLYSRQCRYYGLALLLTVAIAYVYRFYDGRRRSVVALMLLSLALLATHLMIYAAVCAALMVDYAIWGRKRQPLTMTDWVWLLVPQVLLGAPLIAFWNPWRASAFEVTGETRWASTLTRFYRNFRDLNRCEFGVVPLIAVTPLLYFRVRWDWLLRAPLAFLVYVAVVSIVSPQPINITTTADVRYLSPIIPLCIAIEVLALSAIAVATRYDFVAIALGLLASGTNVLHIEPLLSHNNRSTVCDFIAELLWPPEDPYTLAARWVNTHVQPGESVFVFPMFMNYPLMFHAPSAVYAWQLPPSSENQFPGLDPIHFRGKVMPDYIIAFGPFARVVRTILPPDAPVRYEEIEILDIFWKDMIRPELFWRTFRPITAYDKTQDVVFIFRKTPVKAGSSGS
jgi:hypothetical protein